MASLKLHIDETNPLVREVYGNYSDWKLFCILRRYLEPRKRHLSLKDASILIYKILMPVAPGSSIQYPVKAFGSVVLNVAGQIPYSHASQDRLVRLLDQFLQFIEFELTDERETEILFLVLDQLIYALRRRYDKASNSEPLERDYYLNTSAFLARLASTGLLGSSWAVSKMRDALEHHISGDAESYHSYISSAALWIHYYGPCLFYAIARSPLKKSRRNEQSFRVGPLYSGSAFGIERWNFWRNAFKFASEQGKLNVESRDLALNASFLMDEIAEIGVVEAR